MSCSKFRWALFFLIYFKSSYLMANQTHKDCKFPGIEVDGCSESKLNSVRQNCDLLKNISQLVCDNFEDDDIPKFEEVKHEGKICKKLKAAATNVSIVSNATIAMNEEICDYFCSENDFHANVCINILIGTRKLREIPVLKTDVTSLGTTKIDKNQTQAKPNPNLNPSKPNPQTVNQPNIKQESDGKSSTEKYEIKSEIETKNKTESKTDKTSEKDNDEDDENDEKSIKKNGVLTKTKSDTTNEGKHVTEDKDVSKEQTDKTISTEIAKKKEETGKQKEKSNKEVETTKSATQTTTLPTTITPSTTLTPSSTLRSTPSTEDVKTTIQKDSEKETDDVDIKQTKIDGNDEGAQPQDPDNEGGDQNDENENNGNFIDAPEDGEQLQPPKKPMDAVDNQSMDGAMPGPELQQYADFHFFIYFLTAVVLCVLLYLVFHNKQKIIALIIEGRHERRRRSSSVSYKKLDNNLDQVL